MHRAQQLAVAGQLAATVAHEVRNPLTAIRSSLQFVLDSKSGLEHGREILQRLLAEVDRIEDTLSGVLSLSRSHALNASDLELTDVINQSAQLVRPYAEASGVEIHVEPCPTTLPIRGDQRQLRQVFLNLLMNACQAMTGGAVRLRADVLTPSDNQDGATPMAIVHVIDTGSGMSPDQLTRVFDPFFTTKEAGTGLGLPVCLEIVTRHAGRLEITSDLGTGTTATVILPLR
jgi:signal transduction histidine kinase